MEELREKQLEVLQDIVPFSERVLAAIDDIVEQLEAGKSDAAYLKQVSEAINWILEAYNGTRSLINPDGVTLDEASANRGISSLERAKNFKDNNAIADSLYQIGLFIKSFHDIAVQNIAS